LDNTVIFFLSDNGGAGGPEKIGPAFSDSTPFRDGKGSMREGGSHVPFIVHWPAGLQRKGEFDGLVSSLDIAATVVALGKGDRSGHSLEGKNLIPYFNGKKEGSPHEALFWRKSDGAAGWAVRTVESKFLQMSGDSEPELYNMAADPYESENVIEQSQEKREKLAKLWNDWNTGNSANVLLQSGVYQKERLRMYKELYQKL